MMILDGRVSMCGFGIKKTNAKKLIISLMVGGGGGEWARKSKSRAKFSMKGAE